MSNEKKSKRKQAFEIYEEHNGDIGPTAIAHLIGSPPGTVSSWKSKDKWNKRLDGTFKEEKRNARARGAPKGNKNAVGNDGGAPKSNKNAMKTGEYETIYAAYLTDEEKNVFDTQIDTSIALMEEINLLRIRQLRMLKRLKQAENGLDDNEKNILYELRGRKTLIEAEGKKIPVDIDEQLTQTEIQERVTRKIDDVLRIEEALTRVSNLLTRTIKQYEDLEMVDSHVRKQMDEIKLRELEARVKIIENTADKLVLDKDKQSQINDLIDIGQKLMGDLE